MSVPSSRGRSRTSRVGGFVAVGLILAWLGAMIVLASRAGEPLAFAYFVGNGETGMYLAASDDGLAFRTLHGGQPVIRPTESAKLMRDPCIARGPDKIIRAVWTTSWTHQGVGYAESLDLIHWTAARVLDVMAHEPDTRNVWAPELTYDPDGGRWLLYWSSTIPGRFEAGEAQGDDGYNHRIYATTTRDFQTFQPTTLLFDPGHNVIDATIVRDPSARRYVLFYKDETLTPPAKNLLVAVAPSIMGPYEKLGGPITGAYWAEGPTAVLRNGKWWVYFDRYREGRFGLVTSPDLLNWTDESDRVAFPRGARHGTVFPIDAPAIDPLRQDVSDAP